MRQRKTLYVSTRKAWRAWLAQHHASADEVWLVYYKKRSGKDRIPYNDAVEEALCYGWIDSTLKPIDSEKYAQRFTPRRKNAQWSETNIERLRRLLRKKKVTRAGKEAAEKILHLLSKRKRAGTRRISLAPDIQNALQEDSSTWRNFSRFPLTYKRIRIGWIEGARRRPDIFQKRLRYFIKMTRSNKRFGMVQ